MSASLHSIAGKIGAHTRWSKETDRKAATAPARKGFMGRFEREVDPDGTLSAEERARRAEHAMKAYMSRLALARELKRREQRAAKPAPAMRRKPAVQVAV